MEPTASIIVPTRRRAGYLDVALASIAPQAAAAGAELLVVDDGPDEATRAAAERHGARYVAHPASRGLNAARNSGIDAAASDLLVFVDDDVAVRPGWLDALIAADATAEPAVGVLTGPIHARFEDHRLRSCGREGPPITTQDFGPADRDVEHAWGANMTLRRSAIDRLGAFDAAQPTGAGDEEAWQHRLLAAGGRIRYVAAAALDHRRAGDDARLRSLARAALTRGATARRFDEAQGRAPSLRREVTVLLGCAAHTFRYACANGIVLTAHSLGRLRAARTTPADSPDPDYLSGESGTVRGLRRPPLRALDAALDLEARPRLRRIDRAARERPPRRRVLVLGVERPERLMRALRAELHRTPPRGAHAHRRDGRRGQVRAPQRTARRAPRRRSRLAAGRRRRRRASGRASSIASCAAPRTPGCCSPSPLTAATRTPPGRRRGACPAARCARRASSRSAR